MSNKILFNDIDGLVLATISCQPKIDIFSWVGFIDYYYRIILSYEEFNVSIVNLQKSGMIKYERKKLQCTECAKKILVGRHRMSVLNWIFKVQEIIKRIPIEDSYDVLFTLSKEDYISQLNNFHTRANKYYN